MVHSHTRSPTRSHTHDSSGSIRLAFFLNLAFSIIELVGGMFTNSIAIMSDALHDFGDSFSLALARYFQKLSQKKRNAHYSYGYRRFSLLGALINALVLLGGSLFIITESIQRLISPQSTDAKWMFLLAIIGIVINGIAFLRLKKGSSLNERTVGLHILEDVLGRIAVFIGSIVMMFAEVPFLDPLLSLGIAGYILFNIYHNLREVLHIVLQGTPEGLSYEEVEKAVQQVKGVQSLHDIHLWSMDGSYVISSLHIVIEPRVEAPEIPMIKRQIKEVLKKLNIQHSTLEIEQEEVCESCG